MRAVGGVAGAAGPAASGVVDSLDAADRRMNAGVAASDDGEPDVAVAAACDEPVGATSRVGPHPNVAAHEVGVIADTVTEGDLTGSCAMAWSNTTR